MTLYYVHALTAYCHPDFPRVSLGIYRVSDQVQIGRGEVFRARVPIELPIARSPRASFQAVLEQLPDLTTL